MVLRPEPQHRYLLSLAGGEIRTNIRVVQKADTPVLVHNFAKFSLTVDIISLPDNAAYLYI